MNELNKNKNNKNNKNFRLEKNIQNNGCNQFGN